MLRWRYLFRNLTRNKLRTLLTLAAVALPITIFVLSMSVVNAVSRFLDNSAQQLRLAVTQKTSIVNPLPVGHRRKIEALDPGRARILSVCGLRWIGGKIDNEPRPLSTLAVDHDTFVATFPDYHLTAEEIDDWLRDRRAVVVGSATAGRFGWKRGDRITIRPSVPPYTLLEFHVVSTAEQAEDKDNLMCHLDYLDEELKKGRWSSGFVSFYFVKCASKADLEEFRAAIDERFSGTPDETKTQDEKAFMNEFITQQFNLPRNLSILAAVTVFVAVMAATNTMSMSFRDRTNEVATLKAMGFGGFFVFTQIQTESLLLCGIGGLLGAAGPYIAFMHTPLRHLTVPFIQHLDINMNVCLQALGISLGIGIIAAVWPSWLALRMHVVSALRSLE